MASEGMEENGCVRTSCRPDSSGHGTDIEANPSTSPVEIATTVCLPGEEEDVSVAEKDRGFAMQGSGIKHLLEGRGFVPSLRKASSVHESTAGSTDGSVRSGWSGAISRILPNFSERTWSVGSRERFRATEVLERQVGMGLNWSTAIDESLAPGCCFVGPFFHAAISYTEATEGDGGNAFALQLYKELLSTSMERAFRLPPGLKGEWPHWARRPPVENADMKVYLDSMCLEENEPRDVGATGRGGFIGGISSSIIFVPLLSWQDGDTGSIGSLSRLNPLEVGHPCRSPPSFPPWPFSSMVAFLLLCKFLPLGRAGEVMHVCNTAHAQRQTQNTHNTHNTRVHAWAVFPPPPILSQKTQCHLA